MTRTFAARIAMALLLIARVERHPTRAVEHMLAWILLVWSTAVAMPGDMLVGPTFIYLRVIAPEWAWGSFGALISICRIIGLYINGNWRRSPGVRLVGAAFGMIWWSIMGVLWQVAINNGAPDFPMRYGAMVFIYFEAYSCFRCGQDLTLAWYASAPVEGRAGYG